MGGVSGAVRPWGKLSCHTSPCRPLLVPYDHFSRPKCPNFMVIECGKSTVACQPAAVPDLMAALQPHPERESLDRSRRGSRIDLAFQLNKLKHSAAGESSQARAALPAGAW